MSYRLIDLTIGDVTVPAYEVDGPLDSIQVWMRIEETRILLHGMPGLASVAANGGFLPVNGGRDYLANDLIEAAYAHGVWPLTTSPRGTLLETEYVGIVSV